MKEIWNKVLPVLKAIWRFLLRWRKLLVCSIGLILSVCLLVAAAGVDVPSKSISFSSYTKNGYTEYVGGDAYNFIIEAGLRSGFIAGRLTERSVYYAAAAIVFMLTLMLATFGGLLPDDLADRITKKPAPAKETPQQADEQPEPLPETMPGDLTTAFDQLGASLKQERPAPVVMPVPPHRSRRRKEEPMVADPSESLFQVLNNASETEPVEEMWETIDLMEE